MKPAKLKEADPEGVDHRTVYSDVYAKVTDGKPTSNISDYFFLPALGNYDNGGLKSFTSFGYYWSSSVPNDDRMSAYSMFFGKGFVNLQRTDRSYGCVAQPFK